MVIHTQRTSELEIANSRAEDSAKKSAEARSKVEAMCKVYKSEVDTLREALQIAAQTVANAVAIGDSDLPDELMENEEFLAAMAGGSPTERVVIGSDGSYTSDKK
jgi:hypothetical protein